MKGKNDDSTIGVFHLHVAAFPMYFDEAQPLQRCENFFRGE